MLKRIAKILIVGYVVVFGFLQIVSNPAMLFGGWDIGPLRNTFLMEPYPWIGRLTSYFAPQPSSPQSKLILIDAPGVEFSLMVPDSFELAQLEPASLLFRFNGGTLKAECFRGNNVRRFSNLDSFTSYFMEGFPSEANAMLLDAGVIPINDSTAFFVDVSITPEIAEGDERVSITLLGHTVFHAPANDTSACSVTLIRNPGESLVETDREIVKLVHETIAWKE